MGRFATLAIAVFASLIFGCKDNKEVIPPNILFILTDDQRWDALGYAGNEIIHTPNMDELAKDGIYFKNAFVTTPICAASRASLLTGLHERTHDYTFGKPNLHNQYMLESYPYLLRNAGYQTGFVGKFGIKVNEGIEDSLFSTINKTWFPYNQEVDGEQVHLTDINGNHAINFIKKNKDKPFCLSVSFLSPHADDPEEEQYFWPDYVDSLYSEDIIPLPETADPAFFEGFPEFLRKSMNRKRWYWRYDTPEKRQRMVKGYYKMISTVDSVIGRIRSSLREEGLEDNTVIIFMGDNGYFLGERGYAGKWTIHEQSIRVPLMIYDPRQQEADRSKTIEEMVLNIDVTPTILKLAGVDIPEAYQGESLTAFYDSKPQEWRSSIFLEHRNESIPLLKMTDGYRDDTWKFIRYDHHPEYIELYNHVEDKNETQNLAYDTEYTAMIKHLSYVCDSIANKLTSVRAQEESFKY